MLAPKVVVTTSGHLMVHLCYSLPLIVVRQSFLEYGNKVQQTGHLLIDAKAGVMCVVDVTVVVGV